MLKRSLYMCTAFLLSCALAPLANARHIEVGDVTTENTAVNPVFTSVTFQTPFDVTPVVVSMPTTDGTDPADLRIQNVTTTGFEIAAVEAPGSDGDHPGMNVHYVAMEPGAGALPDGTQIVAGFHTTASTVARDAAFNTGWDTVSFGVTLASAASVVANIQTTNSEENAIPGNVSEPFLSTALRNASTTNMQLALERSEVTTGTVSAETIGWIAFPGGMSGSFVDTSGQSISWDARVTPTNVRGFTNGCFTNTFSATAWPAARIVGTRAARRGNNGGWVRRCSLAGNLIGLTIDEDQATDNERAHIDEPVSLLSFSGSFHALLDAALSADKTVAMATPSEYSLPGADVRYTLSAESQGNGAVDVDTIVLIDAIPSEVALKVSDIGPLGGGPVIFNDGSPTSGLTYNFSGLGSSTDDVDFSNDGGSTFNYTPLPDGTGADANVTHIRINPKGAFLAASTAGLPAFNVQFDTVIQ